MKKVYVVTASINELKGLKELLARSKGNVNKIIIIDEGESLLRKRNERLFKEHEVNFYGPREREEWFKKRFGANYEKYLSIIPERCHAEISFGYLIAYEEGADVIIEIDDDVYPVENNDIILDHLYNLDNTLGMKVNSSNKWYNTLENLFLYFNAQLYPRGYPYGIRRNKVEYTWRMEGGECSLNMGLWIGCLDLDALTLILYSALDGRFYVKNGGLKRRKVIVDKGTYFPVCSMNTSFKREIIPAFYQLYMNFNGVDRYDDIWSGVFLKKIVDHLGDKMCLGAPLVYHDKRPRNVFSDLVKEIRGLELNEILWKLVNKVEIDGKTYLDAYRSLIEKLNRKTHYHNIINNYKKIINIQLEKMMLWTEVIDYIL